MNKEVDMTLWDLLDAPSIFRASSTGLLLIYGTVTLNAAAVFVGVLVGLTTIFLNLAKIRNEIKRGRQIDKGIDDAE